LLRGRFLYVDDLVTAEPERSHGHGERLMRALVEEAGVQDCRTIVLDCGVANAGAHRFYFRSGMRITAFRFARDV
jgi:ribosomal protein S18 acetylase RimI-like enzyme